MNDFLNWLKEDSGYSKAEKKSILQRIIEFFDRIVEAVKQTIKDGDLSQTAREFAQMQADKAAQIREMFLDALDGIDGKARKNTAEETKNSIKKTKDISYDEQIEKVFSKHFGRSDSLYIGKPSDNLIKAGFSNAPFAMNQSDIRKSHEATAKNKNYSRHGVSKEFFEQLPSKINNAVMFIVNKNGTTVITDYQMNDRNGEKSFVVAGVWHNQKMDSDVVNQVKSVYPLDDFKSQVYRAAENRKLVITDKKKAQAMLSEVGVQPSERSRLLELSNDSISQTGDDVKHFSDIGGEETKNSLKRPDFNKKIDKDEGNAHNKKRLYNESDTLFLQWSNSPSVPVRERKMFKRGKDLVLFEKTKNGCVELFRSKDKEVVREHERAYRKATDEIYGNTESIRADKGRDTWNMRVSRHGGYDVGNGGQTGNERLQTDSERDNGHLLSGDGRISDITDSEETKNSLRHSLGISDSTAEVASYYGFAAVFAALVASEAADVVDSALAAVVEFVAAALDVAVDSSAEKVPAVEDNSAKADEVSLEFSAGNVVESVDELFCVPFNLKAFKKPFTPRPK